MELVERLKKLKSEFRKMRSKFKEVAKRKKGYSKEIQTINSGKDLTWEEVDSPTLLNPSRKFNLQTHPKQRKKL